MYKKQEKTKESLSKNIFIVHGRDDKPKLELARMLEKLGFNAIILSERPDKARTIIEKQIHTNSLKGLLTT
ncbi:MAG: nucleotide-binding protein [Thermoproteota archaeon]|nr:nucleotide-binding protein [Thermoproteota archaeon]